MGESMTTQLIFAAILGLIFGFYFGAAYAWNLATSLDGEDE
jgi:hypothetical protein